MKITDKYPIKNKAWTEYAPTIFVTEISSLQNMKIDPWNRRIPGRLEKDVDQEGEITGWVAHTTVEGQKVLLHIIND